MALTLLSPPSSSSHIVLMTCANIQPTHAASTTASPLRVCCQGPGTPTRKQQQRLKEGGGGETDTSSPTSSLIRSVLPFELLPYCYLVMELLELPPPLPSSRTGRSRGRGEKEGKGAVDMEEEQLDVLELQAQLGDMERKELLAIMLTHLCLEASVLHGVHPPSSYTLPPRIPSPYSFLPSPPPSVPLLPLHSLP